MTSVISSAEIITSYEKRVLYFFKSKSTTKQKKSQSMSRNDFSLPTTLLDYGIVINFDRLIRTTFAIVQTFYVLSH